jgi:predicted 3-demethylubiquinone-9 3-methyltransferase (glyoxalase superfamily)
MQPQKITTFLWFDGKAEEAAKFYVSLFPRSKVVSADPMSVVFELAGQRFFALNGGPQFKFTEAISLFVECEDQAEVDELWAALIANGGAPSQCGWLKDKYGLSWQIIPKAFMRMMGDPDRKKAGRMTKAMLKMQKLDVAALERAFAGK